MNRRQFLQGVAGVPALFSTFQRGGMLKSQILTVDEVRAMENIADDFDPMIFDDVYREFPIWNIHPASNLP